MLFPQTNALRSAVDLGGYWRFLPDPEDVGQEARWFEAPLALEALTIAVPGAWNEQLAERGLMNYVGAGWYEAELQLPSRLASGQRIWLRAGAADHRADVWLNGQPIGSHEGGFLPFELELTRAWQIGQPNRLAVRVDSRLTMTSLPQGIDPASPLYNTPAYERRHLFPPTRFDFFPYGGLTRAIYLVTTASSRIASINIDASLDGSVRVHVTIDGEPDAAIGGASRMSAHRMRVTLLDDGAVLGESVEGSVTTGGATLDLQLPDARPWSPSDPHLYTARVELIDHADSVVDLYEETFGVREIRTEGGQLLLNDEPLFLTGFGKHEDFPIVGRGQFRAAYLRDMELMRWIGANSFRTSHYPYDEEWLRLADRLGFLVIDEVPAVSLGFWSDDFDELQPLLDTHKRAMSALVERDGNHPSVIAWSTTNEPNLWSEPHYQNEASRKYFQEIYQHTRQIDSTRPVIAITMAVFKEDDVLLESCDIIGINRYFGWYTNPADLEGAALELDRELEATYARYKKPIVVTEYGADTVEGFHSTTAQLFTEEFQIAFTDTYNRIIESKPYCAGAHVWNFADFLTPQHFRRVVLNKKGVFTRSRHPKGVAFRLRQHWRELERIHPSHRPPPPQDGFLVADLTTSSPPRGQA